MLGTEQPPAPQIPLTLPMWESASSHKHQLIISWCFPTLPSSLGSSLQLRLHFTMFGFL